MNTVLHDFLTSGRLGPIRYGMPEDDIPALLGTPEKTEFEHCTIWQREGLKLVTRGGRVVGIYLLCDGGVCLLPAELGPTYVAQEAPLLAEFEEDLRHRGIEYRLDPQLTRDREIGFRTTRGVNAIFEKPMLRLREMGYQPWNNRSTAMNAIFDFLSTGRLGPIALNMLEHDIPAVLDSPESMPSVGDSTTLWRKDDLQLVTEAKRVIEISVFFYEDACSLPLELGASASTEEAPLLEEFEEHAMLRGLEYRLNSKLTLHDQICLRTAAGVE